MSVAGLIEAALLGTEPRRGIWTDRDYLVHALAQLTDSDRARRAALAKPKALLDANKPLRRQDDPWWAQYEETAERLDAAGDYLAADDILTLVNGLRDLERRLGDVSAPDPAASSVSAGAGQVPADTIKKARALAGEYDRGWRHDTPIPHEWAARAYAVLAALVAVDAQEPKPSEPCPTCDSVGRCPECDGEVEPT